MKKIFPSTEYKYYSMAVVEKYDRPCFFSQLKLIDSSEMNYNSRLMNATFYIDYRAKTVDEAHMLDVVQKIQDGFGLAVRVKNRAVKVNDINYDFVGTEKNILSVSIDVQWTRLIDHSETYPLMESAELITKMEE